MAYRSHGPLIASYFMIFGAKFEYELRDLSFSNIKYVIFPPFMYFLEKSLQENCLTNTERILKKLGSDIDAKTYFREFLMSFQEILTEIFLNLSIFPIILKTYKS